HPHIGLATVTYLFEGEMHHRDTLGSDQLITPGAVNWMTAGRGIAHSERTRPEVMAKPHPVHGLQSWVALPKEHEETAPAFFHHGSEDLPEFNVQGVRLKLICGKAWGEEAPVQVFSPIFYVDANMPAGSTLRLPADYTDRAAHVGMGQVQVGNTTLSPTQMAVFNAGEAVEIRALKDSRVMLLGGEPLGGPRFIWWNFVSSSKDRIVQAQQDWQSGKFGLIPGDDKEFIPLPDKPL
ncbi:MAG TPA: pirin family protein, partial [Limnobacter sp.]|nr:pirin family protein [Limnobacter sp.]